MKKCKWIETCKKIGIYDEKGHTCNDDAEAKGYCGQYKINKGDGKRVNKKIVSVILALCFVSVGVAVTIGNTHAYTKTKLFTDNDSFYDYYHNVRSELQKSIGLERIYAYGGQDGIERVMNDGKVNMVVFYIAEYDNESSMTMGEQMQDTSRYWALEMSKETGELLKFEEIRKDLDGSPNHDDLWWIE